MTDPRGILRSPYFWAALAGLILIPAMRPWLRFEPAPPPVLGTLPAYELLDTQGEAFGSRQLAGRVYVVSFIFTRCASICPRLASAMAKLARRYDEAGVESVHLLTISVDPVYDTPERLAEYARTHDAELARWTFLTGDEAAIRELVVGGFKTAIGDLVPAGAGPLDIAHSGKLVLVDGAGRIRGYYDADDLGVDEVFHRAQHVLKEGRRR